MRVNVSLENCSSLSLRGMDALKGMFTLHRSVSSLCKHWQATAVGLLPGCLISLKVHESHFLLLLTLKFRTSHMRGRSQHLKLVPDSHVNKLVI